MNSSETILVTGASGQLGRAILSSLLKRGAKNLVGTTRDPKKLTGLSQQGVQIKAADFGKPTELAEAFEGADRLFLISGTDLGRRVLQHKSAVDAAKQAGIKHIMYTSLPNAEDSVAELAPDHVQTESYIKQSGLKYTILRNSLYAENLMFALPQALETGHLYGCSGPGQVSYVTRQDCADAAAGALMSADQHANLTYDITGPSAYSKAQIAKMVGEFKHCPLAYQDLSAADYKAALMKAGLPETVAGLFASIDASIKNGDLALTSDAVQKLAGRPPQTLKEFLQAAL